MKICIDGFSINNLYSTGLYTYTYELLNHLFQMYPQPTYSIIGSKSHHNPRWKKYKNIIYASLPLNRHENNFNLLEKHIEKNNIAIYHSPNNGFSLPNKKVCKQIMTVHDCMALYDQAYIDSKYYNKFITIFPKAIQSCDKIITVSNFIKKELIHYLKVPESKIVTIYPGCSNQFHPLKKEVCKHYLATNYKIKDDYFLYVGSLHKRKHLDFVLKAYKKVLKKHPSLKLIIIGKTDGKRADYYYQLKILCRNLGIEENVLFMGTINYSHLPYFYNGAICTFNLSFYEGFPLSTIESLACGTPTLCSNHSIFQEILGNNDSLINPKDINLIKDLLLEIYNNHSFKTQLGEKGLRIANAYTWESTIKKLVNIYESIA